MSGAQFYGVTTTGIFCRFGCPSKTPRPENVVFFETSTEARELGFRSCKRCRPDHETSPTEAFGTFVVTQMLAVAIAHPHARIEDIAQGLALSRRQLERVVRSSTGLSPRALIQSQVTQTL